MVMTKPCLIEDVLKKSILESVSQEDMRRLGAQLPDTPSGCSNILMPTDETKVLLYHCIMINKVAEENDINPFDEDFPIEFDETQYLALNFTSDWIYRLVSNHFEKQWGPKKQVLAVTVHKNYMLAVPEGTVEQYGFMFDYIEPVVIETSDEIVLVAH